MELIGLGGLVVALLVVGAVLLILLLAVRSRYQVVGPNEALIISGTRRRQTGRVEMEGIEVAREGALKVVTGGGTFIWPLVQRASRLSLEAMQLPVTVRSVPTSNKVPITVGATANVRIGNTIEEINAAATRFLSWDDTALVQSINEILEGSLRAIIGTMTVERIIEDRTEFTKQVQQVAAEDLKSMGLVIDVMNVKEITDEQQYIQNLGVPRVQEVRRVAETARFEVELAIEQENQRTAREKAQAKQETDLLTADILERTSAAERRADQAGPLAEAEARRRVVETETEVARLAAVKREEELVAEVRKPAEAEAHRLRTIAEAEKERSLRMVEASAEGIRLEGIAEADAEEAKARAEGAKVREVALARAEGQMKEAEAINSLKDNSVRLRMLEVQPEIVRASAQAFQGVDHVVLVGEQGVKSFIGMLPVLMKSVVGNGGDGPLSRLLGSSPPDGGGDAQREETSTTPSDRGGGQGGGQAGAPESSRAARVSGPGEPGTREPGPNAPSLAGPGPAPAQPAEVGAELRRAVEATPGEDLEERLLRLAPEAGLPAGPAGELLDLYQEIRQLPLEQGIERLVQLARTDPAIQAWAARILRERKR
jgi:flotillin